MKTKGILKTFFTVSFCVVVFAAGAYLYLTFAVERQNSAADTKESGIPYSSTPDDSGVLFVMPDGSGALIRFVDNTSTFNPYVGDVYGKDSAKGIAFRDSLVGKTNGVTTADVDFMSGATVTANGNSLTLNIQAFHPELIKFTMK